MAMIYDPTCTCNSCEMYKFNLKANEYTITTIVPIANAIKDMFDIKSVDIYGLQVEKTNNGWNKLTVHFKEAMQ